jgi:aminoacrylate hydrolase
MYGQILSSHAAQHHKECHVGQPARGLGAPDVQASRLAAILAFDRRDDLHRIAIPTFVVRADDDVLTPRYFSEEYVDLIPGARSQRPPRGGHALSRTEPVLFNQIVLNFFAEAAHNVGSLP